MYLLAEFQQQFKKSPYLKPVRKPWLSYYNMESNA